MQTGLRACERAGILLAMRDDGKLDGAQLAELDVHVIACPRCRELADVCCPAEPSGAPMFPPVDQRMYELGPVIGHGGMGRIRVARDLRINRRVAIKELLFNTDALAARFVREARIAARLQHPNIVPVYDVGTWEDGTPFYSMRLVEGRTLFEAIRCASTLDERMQLLPAVIAAADAVAFAHSEGVLHRDLTPANVLLGRFGETVVIDWGLAKELRFARERVGVEFQTGVTMQELTAKGDVVGSPAYMPREQAEGEVIDERADVYALGAILYHLLAGRAPYAGACAKDVLARVRATAPVPLVANRVLQPLLGIVAKAMARDANDRYQNARELAGELRRFETRRLVGAPVARDRAASWFARAGATLLVVAMAGGLVALGA